MISIPKKRADLFLRPLFKNLGQLQRDCDLLGRWARMRKIATAGRLALIFQDGIESLRSDLVSFREILEQAPVAPKSEKNPRGD